MNHLEYAICKCAGFGFSKDHDSIPKHIDENREIIVIHDEKTKIENLYPASRSHFYTDLHQLENDKSLDRSKPFYIIVELGYVESGDVKIDSIQSQDDFDKSLEDFESDEFAPGQLRKFKEALKYFKSNPEYSMKNEYSPDFVHFLELIYPHINDAIAQRAIIEALITNHTSATQLQRSHPIASKTERRDIVKRSYPFKDIPVKDPFIDEDEFADRGEDVFLRLKNGDLASLNGLGSEYMIVGNSKRTGTNNESKPCPILEQLAQNQIVTNPIPKEGAERLSSLRLIDELTKFDNFKIVFVWPHQQIFVFSKDPSDNNRPTGTDGTIILNVFFFLITRSFFGLYEIAKNRDFYERYLM